ncbi:mechanosensitive ion channel domain-containing protein [uncultured Draconibacterium sp.]|uniref:mechanosensitive ion channel family protein n=1 Tax=uncultured Draconibacterium sp. TaxID=1573823 RepID=UPI0025EC904F|nr:mechanosensitive ion channel domain-containing protein [uncultured Draconibacterium sp.]
MEEKLQGYLEMAYELIVAHGMKVVMAIVVLIIGLWIISRIVKVLDKVMEKREVNVSLRGFFRPLVSILLKVMLFISIASMIGIETTSFIAVLGAAGLAIGLALQGTLANFAGGVMILLFKPFKIGDLIESQGHKGTVKEIHIFVTVLLTFDNKTVIIPNAAVSNNDIVNYTTQGILRVDMTFGISYDSNIKEAKDVLMNIVKNHPKVLKDPTPFVGVAELADSSVNLVVRPYAKVPDYWAVYFDVYEGGKVALDKAGITIPFPQMDVHLDK